MATVRYLVNDVGAALDFYNDHTGLVLAQRYGAAMAIVQRDGLQLWFAGPMASATRPMPDGRQPQPGGWNRIVIEVDDLHTAVTMLRAAGARFRNDPISGPGGRQVLLDDPSGNPVGLFETA
jgi:catechol 2,3-dioxygenase-like lactoylglutathione lyase family enzyme